MPGRKMTPQEKEIKKIVATNLNSFLSQNNAKKIEISKVTKIPPSTLTGYFNGTRLPTPENVEKLAKFFHVSKQDIDPRFKPVFSGEVIMLDGTKKFLTTTIHDSKSNQQTPIADNAIPLEQLGLHRIPVIGTIACGEPIDADQNVIDYMTIPGNIPNDAFALICEGNSMEPGLHDGDRVIIEPTPNVEDGEIAAVLVDGDTKATLKRIKHVGDTIELIPDNDDYDKIVLDKDHPGRILGRKIQMIRYGSR